MSGGLGLSIRLARGGLRKRTFKIFICGPGGLSQSARGLQAAMRHGEGEEKVNGLTCGCLDFLGASLRKRFGLGMLGVKRVVSGRDT